ncbi:helix-turn-helix domain-containing protein [Streptomyces graminilatus]|uniref:helix-turn-helix domain-containing protein n=1 Tax=Streptomyces graminilatus TaxID=1464070 RepID=UPI0006E269E3|nr:helix-turn-helix transcriptional regulator [Streptomyces graminilatus]
MRGDKAPHAYTDGEWPAEVSVHADAPPGVHYALVLARALDDALTRRGLSQRSASTRAGLNATAVGRIIRGLVYPDLSTIARLETALQTDLLPRHLFRTLPASDATTENTPDT